MRMIAFALMTLFMPASAAAASIESTCYAECEARDVSNVEFKACLAEKAEAADAVLNDAYGILRKAILKYAKEMGQESKYQLQSLKEAQRNWIAFRDVTCRFEDELSFGRSSLGGNYSACLCIMSLQRVADFDRIGRLLSE